MTSTSAINGTGLLKCMPITFSGRLVAKAMAVMLRLEVLVAKTAFALTQGVPPEALTMGIIGVMALLANAGVALLLYAFRDGDANMRSVWLCSRNDAIGNIAVMIAAAGVFGTGSGLPDILVGVVMAGMGLSSGLSVVKQARQEMATGRMV